MDAIPGMANVASLIGDPTRSLILSSLMDGRALTVSELAEAAGVAVPTASGHLSRLEEAGLVKVERQGRHRYMRLADPQVAQVLEGLMALAHRGRLRSVKVGPSQTALRRARVCYDHLAGEQGVAVLDALRSRGYVVGQEDLEVTTAGHAFFVRFGVPLEALQKGRRPLCRACLDWSERRHHLAGALGAALLERWVELRWLNRTSDRTLTLTPRGAAGFAADFAAECAPGAERLKGTPG